MDTDSLISQCLIRIRNSSRSPFAEAPTPGYLRGIDVYDTRSFMMVLRDCFTRFVDFHGYPPNFAEPTGFDEKILRAKFFSEFKVPQSGNKLLTASFIPPGQKDTVHCAKIAWHSGEPTLPANDALPPGTYFLKASHGSGMVCPVTYPLDLVTRRRLESMCHKWLTTLYGIHNGEWWYNVFKSEILLEEPIGSRLNTVAWNVLAFRGRIGAVTAYSKFLRDGSIREASLWYDCDFNVLPFQHPTRPRLQHAGIPNDLKDRIAAIASAISASFPFVRVDLLVDDDERILLGELTFAPNGGLNRRPREYDAYLGSLWDM